jgi:hypothetical protein
MSAPTGRCSERRLRADEVRAAHSPSGARLTNKVRVGAKLIARPLPEGVECFAAAALLGSRRSRLVERLVGDGLVPLASALGSHTDPARALAFAKSHQWIGYGMGHLDLLNRPEVYVQLMKWLN